MFLFKDTSRNFRENYIQNYHYNIKINFQKKSFSYFLKKNSHFLHSVAHLFIFFSKSDTYFSTYETHLFFMKYTYNGKKSIPSLTRHVLKHLRVSIVRAYQINRVNIHNCKAHVTLKRRMTFKAKKNAYKNAGCHFTMTQSLLIYSNTSWPTIYVLSKFVSYLFFFQ